MTGSLPTARALEPIARKYNTWRNLMRLRVTLLISDIDLPSARNLRQHHSMSTAAEHDGATPSLLTHRFRGAPPTGCHILDLEVLP